MHAHPSANRQPSAAPARRPGASRAPASLAAAGLRAALGLAALLGFAAIVHADAGAAGAFCRFEQPDFLQQINAVRAGGANCGGKPMPGSGPVSWSDPLRDMAQIQAQFLADIEDLRHAGPNGQTIVDRAAAAGYRFQRVAENLALGARSIDHVLRAWTASATHCQNLYDQRFTEVGLVCERGKGGRPLWVMVLGRPKALGPAPAPAPTP